MTATATGRPTQADPSHVLVVPAEPGSARLIADFVHGCTLLDKNVHTSNITPEGEDRPTHIQAVAW